MSYNFDEIIPRHGTSSVKYDLREKYFGRKDVIPMWVADMDFATPDFIREAVIERASHPVYGYSIRPEAYFESIISWLLRRHSWEVQKEWIRFSPGVVPAVNLCVQAYSKPGDKIIVQPPVYFPFFSAIKNNNRVLLENPLQLKEGRLHMDFDDLRSKIDERTKMILLCSPHNPGGSVWTREEMEELASVCLENDIIIISDEIHNDLVYSHKNHIPTASISERVADITVTCIAPSKTFNLAGMATSSVIISNESLRKDFDLAMERVHIANGNLFGTAASIAAYKLGQPWLEQLIEYLSNNASVAVDFLNNKVPGITTSFPESTYMLWLDCRELGMESEELWRFFINEAGVGLNNGAAFGKGGEQFLRLNFACPQQVLNEALDRIYKAVSKL